MLRNAGIHLVNPLIKVRSFLEPPSTIMTEETFILRISSSIISLVRMTQVIKCNLPCIDNVKQ